MNTQPTETQPIIAAVYVWQNDLVMVFDAQGKQIAAYQGYMQDVSQRILNDAPSTTHWYDAVLHGGCTELTRARWAQRVGAALIL